eukprot:TRINITY_DN781850_c0_g1_i1.p1 TRINITY_DN781850_c0_g1~~TRINITY_DN781850_c0_g1_i1.p1  ORF type:complete len:149 (+),score=51.89 TRINITY_DN781850_c0_g1_i1:45-449(+)
MSQILQKGVQEQSAKLQKLQGQLQEVATSSQKLQAQHHENQLVLDELERIDDDKHVFKLCGPILVKKSADEAKENVRTRLSMIKTQIDKCEKQIKHIQGQQQESQKKLIEMDRRMKEKAAIAAQEAAQIATQHS